MKAECQVSDTRHHASDFETSKVIF